MGWRRKGGGDEPVVSPEDVRRADEAVRNSEIKKQQSSRRAKETGKLAESLRVIRERNHLREAFETAWGVDRNGST